MSHIIDLTGMRFGKLVAISMNNGEFRRKSGKKIIKWNCVCDCGNNSLVSGVSLRSGNTTSCGCNQKEFIISKNKQSIKTLAGNKFGRLTVLDRNFTHKVKTKKTVFWNCVCDCGNNCVVSGSELKSGGTQSCGCLHKERTSVAKFIDLSGMKFGNLRVIKPSGKKRGYGSFWICKCLLCGRTFEAFGGNIKSGDVVSCGCSTESFMASALKKYFISNHSAIVEYRECLNPESGHPLPYDIFIPQYKIYIEVHGQQHYKYSEHWHVDINAFKYQKKKDKVKRTHARKNGIYFEVDLRKNKEPEYWIRKIEDLFHG